MGLFRKTPQEKEEKRKKNFEKQMGKLEDLLEKSREEIPNATRIIFSSTVSMVIKNAMTKEEYRRASRPLGEWLEFVIKVYGMDRSQMSFGETLKLGASDVSIKLNDWNALERNVLDAVYGITVSGDFESVVRLVDEFFTIRPKIMNMRINRSYAGERLVYNKEKIFVSLALYSGFAKYKLGDLDGALEVFNAFETLRIPFEMDEGDYACAVFGEFGGEINSSDLIKVIDKEK